MKQIPQAFLIVIMGVAASGIVGYNQCYLPQLRKAQRIQQQIEQEQTNQQLATEVAGVFRQIERYRQQLPQEPDPSWVVRQAVTLGQRAGILLTNITPVPAEERPQYTRLSVGLQFRASYHQLGAFLDQIERDPSFFLIERLELGEPAEQSDQAAVQMTLSTLHVLAIR